MQSTLVRNQITVICPTENINAANATEFQRQLTTAVASEDVSILLVDMGQVEYIDSAGLMALVSTLSLAQRLERRFTLCTLSPSVRMILELTQLDRVFEICEDRAAFEAARLVPSL